MITDEGKYYLYRHVRLDKSEPFYIGIGTKPKVYKTYRAEYHRAFSVNDRTKFWKHIVKKAEYRVEIILESNDYNFIQQKEIEFIKLYGRRDKNVGNLINMTDGGRAFCEIPNHLKKWDQRRKDNKSKEMINAIKSGKRIHPTIYTIGKFGKDAGHSKSIHQINKDSNQIIETWHCIRDVKRQLGISCTSISNVLHKRSHTAGGFKWEFNQINKY